MTRVAIVEDHPAIADGLAAILAGGGLDVIGVAGSVETAAELLEQGRPEVVLCDIMLEGRDAGFELLERFHPTCRFLMLSAYDYPAHHARAIDAGASGYLFKMADVDTLLHAVRAVSAGRSAFAPAVRASARRALRPLTPRERQLLELLAEGATNERIATDMAIAVKTVEGMLRRLFDRYGVESRTQLLRLAGRQGWLTSTPR